MDNYIRFTPHGSLLEYTYKKGGSSRSGRRCDRPAVRAGFSYRSRSRLNRKISMLNRSYMPLFLTLTYGNRFPTDYRASKRHLDTFFKRVLRRFPAFGAVWKMEYQKRGAFHYHLLVYGVSVRDRYYLVHCWNQIVAKYLEYTHDERRLHLLFHLGKLKDRRGRYNQHACQSIRSWGGVVSYASKYMAKLDDTTTYGGRIWGIVGSHVEAGKRVFHVPFARLYTLKISLQVAMAFRSAFQAANNFEFRRLGFWTMNFHPDWLVLLDQIDDYYSLKHPEFPDDWNDYDFPDEAEKYPLSGVLE